MLRQLEQEIRAQQLLIEEDRLAFSASVHAFGYQLRRKLATPQALGASFGVGALAALLRCRKPGGDSEPETDEGPSHSMRLVGWLLRDVVMPVALGAITQARAAQQQADEEQAW